MQKQLSLLRGAAAKTSLASNLEASAGQMRVLDTAPWHAAPKV